MLYADRIPPNGNRIEYRIWDSMEELIGTVQTVPADRMGVNDWTRRPGFTGRRFESWDAVYQAVREPWTDGLAVVDRMLRELADADLPAATSRRRTLRWRDDDGDELDHDRLRAGQSFWRSTRRRNTRGPATVTVIVDVAANCNVEHEDILWRGAAALTLATLLEAAGYRVELWAVAKTTAVWSTGARYGWDRDAMSAVRLKAPGDPLDSATLVAAVSGWAFRTLFFRAWCLGHWQISDDLGYAQPPTAEDLDQVSRDADRILVAGAFSYERAMSLIRFSLEGFSERSNKS